MYYLMLFGGGGTMFLFISTWPIFFLIKTKYQTWILVLLKQCYYGDNKDTVHLYLHCMAQFAPPPPQYNYFSWGVCYPLVHPF